MKKRSDLKASAIAILLALALIPVIAALPALAADGLEGADPSGLTGPTKPAGDLSEFREHDELVIEQRPSVDETVRHINDMEIPRIGFGSRSISLYSEDGDTGLTLLNLILCALCLIYAAVNSARALFHRKREPEELRSGWLATSIAMAVLGALLFLLKLRIGNAMVLLDLLTLAHSGIFAVELLSVIFLFRRKKCAQSAPTEEAHDIIRLKDYRS